MAILHAALPHHLPGELDHLLALTPKGSIPQGHLAYFFAYALWVHSENPPCLTQSSQHICPFDNLQYFCLASCPCFPILTHGLSNPQQEQLERKQWLEIQQTRFPSSTLLPEFPGGLSSSAVPWGMLMLIRTKHSMILDSEKGGGTKFRHGQESRRG